MRSIFSRKCSKPSGEERKRPVSLAALKPGLRSRREWASNTRPGAVDFVLAFAVVHEMPSVEKFFSEAAAALKPSGILFLAEPSGHVNREIFQIELDAARKAGLEAIGEPVVRRSHAAVLRKL